MTQPLQNQEHLSFQDKINLGAFYTPKQYVNIVWEFIHSFIDDETVVLDNSCGYGNFFDTNIKCKKIGNDIDSIACDVSKKNFPDISIFNSNALANVNRKSLNICDTKRLIAIGNPPYNDISSIIRNNIKNQDMTIDTDIKTRDYGMSFLLSFSKLEADVICVLHPLSYLIKQANFNLLKNFFKKYKLVDGQIINSASFKETSKGISFPIIIALYKKYTTIMTYEDIHKFVFKTIQSKKFSLNNFDYISKYIRKYPIKNQEYTNDDIFFWTMRDINALKRNQTFVKKHSENSIIIDKSKLDYYIYVDVFKQFSKCIPYYFGNFEVFIDNQLFIQNKHFFINEFLLRNPILKKHYADINIINDTHIIQKKIISYFKILLEEHYVH